MLASSPKAFLDLPFRNKVSCKEMTCTDHSLVAGDVLATPLKNPASKPQLKASDKDVHCHLTSLVSYVLTFSMMLRIAVKICRGKFREFFMSLPTCGTWNMQATLFSFLVRPLNSIDCFTSFNIMATTEAYPWPGEVVCNSDNILLRLLSPLTSTM